MWLRQAVPVVLCSILLILSFSVVAIAQVDRGAIVGTVTDQGGARIASAEVTVTNTETNQPTTVTTNEEGSFAVNLLALGRIRWQPGRRASRGRFNRASKLV